MSEDYYYRDFLNSKRGTALIEVDVTYHKAGTYEGSSFDANITLKDCNRQMCLEFWCGNETDRLDRLQKLNTIIREASIVRDKLAAFKFEPKIVEKGKKAKKPKISKNLREALNL